MTILLNIGKNRIDYFEKDNCLLWSGEIANKIRHKINQLARKHKIELSNKDIFEIVKSTPGAVIIN